MSKSFLSSKALHDEEAAYEFLEGIVWPEGPVCPHCGGFERVGKLQGKTTRVGLYKCYQCRKPFRVTVGTVLESSHVPLHKWLQAIILTSSPKTGNSSNQLHRTLCVTLQTAWYMSHRLREAMRVVGIKRRGGEGAVVEASESGSSIWAHEPKLGSETMKSDQSQIERFIESAREIGADETGETFLRLLRKVVPARRSPKS